ncbi:MAG TPA: cyclic peptide export ABC transporter [Thermoanaerobaculia bacterium]|nr:cyclic peptide export ABC transporter [Thermoanaerobaculia bacterium]
MKDLFAILRQCSRTSTLVVATALGLLSGAMAGALPHVVREVLEGPEPDRRWVLAVLFFTLSLAISVTRVASSLILVVLGAQAVADLQSKLSRKILGSDMRRLEEIGAHRLTVALTNDITSITGALTTLPIFFLNAATVFGCLVYMAWMSLSNLFILLATLAVMVPIYLVVMRSGWRRQRLVREVEDDLFKFFRGVTQGTKELKMRWGRREDYLAQLDVATQHFRRLRIAFMRVFLAGANWGNFLFYCSIGVVLFGWRTAGVANAAGSAEVASAQTGYVLTLLFMIGPFQVVLNSLPLLAQAGVSVQKIERLGLRLVSDPSEEREEDRALPRSGWRSLELSGVVLGYRREEVDEPEFSLGPIDLVLRPGEVVFLSGGNGSGKTTLAKVLVGLYPPDSGRIVFDGEPVTEANRDWFRQHFSIVFSDFFLFDTLLGLDSPDLDERARKHLVELHLQHKVRVAGGKLSTIELSQGQRKRLALLMAFLEDSPIFVFDEWAADQDFEFRQVFYYQILPELRARGKAVVVISHDESYYGVGDRVVHLEYGKLVDERPIMDENRALA